MALPILNKGSNEPFKATIHGFALGLAALMGLYNGAAWLRRRESHLAVNAVIYGLAIVWERKHFAHHLAACPAKAAGLPVPAAPAPPVKAGRKAA